MGINRGLNILSCFDGMACGLVALKRAGIKVDNYFASEVDKYAIKIAMKNHPEIQQLGDINNYESWVLPKIDLIIGGSPCQGFSFAGKQLNFDDPRSELFFKFVEILWKYEPKYFLMENVKMKKEYQDAISELLELEPVLINSALVSAQNRKRLYWCNFNIEPPDDKGILLKDIIDNGFVDRDKSLTMCATYRFNPSLKEYTEQKRKQIVFTDKSQTIPATIYKENAKSMIKRNKKGLLVKSGARRGRGDEIRKDDKSNALLSDGHQSRWLAHNGELFRKLAPIECERLQTLPDNYTEGVSNTQRYKMIGNGWTVDVISHILKNIPLNF